MSLSDIVETLQFLLFGGVEQSDQENVEVRALVYINFHNFLHSSTVLLVAKNLGDYSNSWFKAEYFNIYLLIFYYFSLLQELLKSFMN